MTTIKQELTQAALAVSQVDFAHLKKFHLVNSGVAEMGRHHHQFGFAPVIDVGDGLFAPSTEGTRRLIVPVYEDGELLDLVAISTADPDDWLLRTGDGLALGLWAGWERHRWCDRVVVHRNPLDWLRSGGDGLCVVNWAAPEIYMLNDLASVEVGDHALATQLKAAVTRPSRHVPIFLAQRETSLAA